MTVHPKNPNFALQKRRMLKQSRGGISRTLERYFVVDDILLTYFNSEKDSNFKKHISLSDAVFLLETKENHKEKWHESKYKYRLTINLLSRSFVPLFFYANDLNEVKTLAARINKASTLKVGELSKALANISKLEKVLRFKMVWQKIERVYDQRLLKMISFQLMGINLIELSVNNWYQRQKLIKFWSNQILKKEKKPILRSTFKYGLIRAKAKKGAGSYKTSLLVREYIKKLLSAFKNRKLQRHPTIQQNLNDVLEKEERGIDITEFKVCYQGQGALKGLEIENSKVRVEGHKFLLFEKYGMQHDSSQDDFFEQNGPLRFTLEDIGCMATDLYSRQKGDQNPINIRIYGRTILEKRNVQETINITPAEIYLDVDRRIPEHIYIINIEQIELPYEFVQKYSQKGDIRIRIRQAKTSENLKQSFFVDSRVFKIDMPSKHQINQSVKIDGQGLSFSLDKLNVDDPNEIFQINLLFSRNNVPLKQIMKEFLFQEEFTCSQQLKYESIKKQVVTISDGKKLQFKCKFSIEKVQNQTSQIPVERQGKRILIGRYVIGEKRKPLRVKTIHRDGTLDLISLTSQSEQFLNTPQSKIKIIEKYGVNVYDLQNLPQTINNSQYTWIIDLKTFNKKLVNFISSRIQERQAQLSFASRNYKEIVTNIDIEGKLLFSIIEARKIQTKGECNPYVKISITPKFYDKQGQQKQTNIEKIEYETQVVGNSNNPVWVNEQNPCGKIFDLGNFCLDKQSPSIEIQMLNKTKKGDELLGKTLVQSYDLIDIQNPAQEKFLILEGGLNYCFLIVQSLFIPKKHTRLIYELMEDISIFKYPEQYLHYKYLLMQKVYDEFRYQVPACQFYPNYLEKLITQAVIIGQNQVEEIIRFQSPLLESQGIPDKTSTPWLIQLKNKLCSNEEQVYYILKMLNLMRPDVEEGILNFKYLWKHRFYVTRQEAFMNMQQKYWNNLIDEIVQQNEVNKLETIEDLDPNDGNFILDSLDQKLEIIRAKQKNWFGKRDDSAHHVIRVRDHEKGEELKLLFRGIWESESQQKYADVYYLIQQGTPPSLRSMIWRDLLNVTLIDYQERQHFQKNYSINYDKNKTLYLNFKELSSKQDCLAFRQIDEDIQGFKFPKHYLQGISESERICNLNKEKIKMRNILRNLVLWSKTKIYEGKDISYSYTKGLLYIVQRLINIASEEEAFWILNGIITSIPRFFSTETSCLEGGRQSVMRYEMTAFKAILRENLPQICDKLKIFGFSVEQLIYDSITSFYSCYFSSEVVLRLWDLIIFNLSNKDKNERKRAVWHILAPAYILLREKQEEILSSFSIQQIIDIYNNGCALTYNPDWLVSEIQNVIKNIFIRGTYQQNLTQNKSTGKLSLLSDFMKKPQQIDKAKLLEQTFRQYEQDISSIFNSIELENKEVGLLLDKTNLQGKQGQGQYLDYIKWRTHVMAKFKKVALKNSEAVEDDLYEFDEPDLNRENLDLSKVNLFLHRFSHLSGIRLFKLRICYGKQTDEKVFQTLEEHFSDYVYNNLKLQQYHVFDYLNGYNQIKIELYDPNNDEGVICETLINLRDINVNKFIKKYVLMQNENLLDNAESYRFPFTQLEISFFLQTHTASQHNEMMQDRNVAISQFINSIKRKLPDRIDIFNKNNETSFYQIMRNYFKKIILEEFEALKCFLPVEQAKNVINDNYNYIEDSDFGDLTLSNLQYLIKQCFFSEWTQKIEKIYKLFVKDNEEESKQHNVQMETSQDQEVSIFSKLKMSMLSSPREKLSLKRNSSQEPQNSQIVKENKKVPFSLRNFIVSLVLMSHCTVEEKLDILYDLFDWNDGVADGLDMNSIFLLIKTIFERNLYYWPSQELFNTIEFCFDSQVSMIYQAFWTNEQNIASTRKSIKLKEVLQNHSLLQNSDVSSIEVTDEIQQTLNSYQSMFGTKIVDFNYDSSAFKNIELLIKGGLQLAQMNKNIQQTKNKYRLLLFCTASSERFVFEVQYDVEGQLIKNRELIEKNDLDEYLKRNINKLYLQGRSKGISKQEFMQKTAKIPFLQDLIRVETLYRDRIQSTLKKKKKLQSEIIVLLNFDEYLFVFRFQQKVMSNVEGELQKISENTYRILMTCAYEEDVVADLRERIILAIESIIKNNKTISKINTDNNIVGMIGGIRDFMIIDSKKKEWVKASDFQRIVKYIDDIQGDQMVFKLMKSKYQYVGLSQEEDRDLAAYDCYSLYKHSDQSYEWRLCKIVRKELVSYNTDLFHDDKNSYQNFNYWIEFLHLRQLGQELWLKRKRQEILISARYAREQQRNYEQETLKFIRETYDNQQEQMSPNYHTTSKKFRFQQPN